MSCFSLSADGLIVSLYWEETMKVDRLPKFMDSMVKLGDYKHFLLQNK